METGDGFDLPRFNVNSTAGHNGYPIYNQESSASNRSHRRVSSLLSGEQSLPVSAAGDPPSLNRTGSLSSSFYPSALGQYRQDNSQQQLQPYPPDSYNNPDYSNTYAPRRAYTQTAPNRVTLSPRSSLRQQQQPSSPSISATMEPPSYSMSQHPSSMYPSGLSSTGHDPYGQQGNLDPSGLAPHQNGEATSPSPSGNGAYRHYSTSQQNHLQASQSRPPQQSQPPLMHHQPPLDMYSQPPVDLIRSSSSNHHSNLLRQAAVTPSTQMPHRGYSQSGLQPQTPGQTYYPPGLEQPQVPASRKQAGLRRIRDVGELRPVVNPQPQDRRIEAESGQFMSPLSRLTKHISQTYNWCNPAFSYEIAHNPRRVLTKPSKPSHNDGYDNEDYDYILYVNDWLGAEDGRNKYLILDVLGQGTFGQVVKCQNMKTNQIVAVKVVKNKPAYFNQSMMEVKILQQLNDKWDLNDEHHILRLRETFIHKNHLCLVFELLSSNLYELIKQNQFGGLSTQLVKVFTTQLLDSLTVLKEARLIHCDLKPENILLKSLQSPQIKVIDFGSACFEGETVYTYIQSRFYRSPEVLLGLQYSSAIDMWSLGCIAVELFLGLPLFPGTSEYNQITRIVEMLGMPPLDMLERGKQSRNFFYEYQDDYGGKHWRLKTIEQYSRDRNENEQPGKKYFAHNKLPDIIKSAPLQKNSSKNQGDVQKEMAHREAFIDFVTGLLNLNPDDRWTPQQAKLHPFITGEKFTRPFVPPPTYSNGRASAASMGSSSSVVSSDPGNARPKQPYGGLVQQAPKGQRAYDAESYSQRLAAQQQMYATHQAQQAQTVAANNASRNPYVQSTTTPNAPQQYPASGAQPTSFGPSAYVTGAVAGQYDARNQMQQMPLDAYPAQLQQSQQRMQGAHGSIPGGYGVSNQGDHIPPHLARTHPHLDLEPGMTGRNMTPKINRDIREWERRDGRIENGPVYPQLEALEQQAQQGRWMTYTTQGGGTGHNRYAPVQSSSLAHQFQSPPAAVVVDSQDKSNSALRDVAMSSVRAAAGIGGRYDMPQNPSAPAPPQPAYAGGSSAGRYAAAASGQNLAYQSPPQAQAPSMDSYDTRDALASLYTPLQPNTYYANSSGSQSQGPSSPQVAQRNQSFYGAAVAGAGGLPNTNSFSPAQQTQHLGQNSTKDGRRMSGMDVWSSTR